MRDVHTAELIILLITRTTLNAFNLTQIIILVAYKFKLHSHKMSIYTRVALKRAPACQTFIVCHIKLNFDLAKSRIAKTSLEPLRIVAVVAWTLVH